MTKAAKKATDAVVRAKDDLRKALAVVDKVLLLIRALDTLSVTLMLKNA